MNDLLNQRFTFVDIDYVEEGATFEMSVSEVLAIINDPTCHTDNWLAYDEKDWVEGMCEWTGYGVHFKKGQKFINPDTKEMIILDADTTEPICDQVRSVIINGNQYHLNRFYPVG
jgi:hypothetical protein